jgi:hypothetical protein
MILVITLAAVTLSVSPVFSATEHGTSDEAKEMLKMAVKHYRAVGRDSALADFNGKKGPWVDRDLYVFCIDRKDIIIANSVSTEAVGKSLDLIKDSRGNPVGQAMWQAVAKTGSGSLQYQVPDPLSGKVEPKTSFLKKVGDDLCGVGIYMPDS